MRSNFASQKSRTGREKRDLELFEWLASHEREMSTPVRDRAIGSKSSMRLLTATRNFGSITAIAPIVFYHHPNNPGVSLAHRDDHNPQKKDKRAAPPRGEEPRYLFLHAGASVTWRRPSVGALFIRTVAVMPQAEGRRRVSFGLAIPARDKRQKPRPSALKETHRSYFFFWRRLRCGAPSFKSEAAVRERTLPRLTPA